MSLSGIEAVIIGIIQGITEFLPVSSSFHTALAAEVLGSHAGVNMAILGAEAGTFLALSLYFIKLIFRPEVIAKVFLGSLPIAIFMLVFSKGDTLFLAPVMLILGAVVMFLCERLYRPRHGEVSYLGALIIGTAQILAIVPGVSRSGSTIVCGLFLGVERKKAVEFAFLLSLPPGFASVCLGLWKARGELLSGDFTPALIGFVAAFITACFAIKPCLRFLSTHKLFAIAIYRIALGCIVLLFAL